MIAFIFLANVEVYHGVKRGARNGVDTTALLHPVFFSQYLHEGLTIVPILPSTPDVFC